MGNDILVQNFCTRTMALSYPPTLYHRTDIPTVKSVFLNTQLIDAILSN